jgi:hypothetical protein
VSLYGFHVPSAATTCVGATTSEGPIWQIRDLGDGATPLSFAFPTPFQYKPPANTKACLKVVGGGPVQITTMNAVGFYGG